MQDYNPLKIEEKWQDKWQSTSLYRVNLKKAQKRFYLLVEFTYPSGDLHMGHWFAFSVPDILARYKKANGYEVFAPNGFDAFGLPAENAAITRGVHPKDWTYSNIKIMKKQFATMGISFDWKHEVVTSDPEYYRWNQWIFLKMYDRGLVYRAKALANWCPKDQCVLANENVEDGKCWRCQSDVVQKEVEQWFLKITDYAEKLIWPENPKVDWPQSIREGQNNWIGKSKGALINFKLKDSKEVLDVFTTRPDTLFGATFLVLAPEHPLVTKIIAEKHSIDVKDYLSKSAKKSELERKEMKQKAGVFTGSYAINPVNGEEIPIWIADYVLMGYGAGAIMAVPAHDERDFEFAKKYDLPIVPVILNASEGSRDSSPAMRDQNDQIEEAYNGPGVLINSAEWNGLQVPKDLVKIIDRLEKKGIGKRKVVYQLHDWSISRQRYWGTPIPIIYCANCGMVPVAEKDLPVELPYNVDFAPKGVPPLATAEDWVKVKCPECGREARREVETMDTFVDSSWYFLAYLREKKDSGPARLHPVPTSSPALSAFFSDKPSISAFQKDLTVGARAGSPRLSPKSKKTSLPWDPEILEKWMPVDIYFGGSEHTLGHTLYSRFFVKFLQDQGFLNFDEYAKKRVNHGVILGPDGSRMSKSHGNVVNPDEEVKKYGADTVRLYLAFLGPYDVVAPWNPSGIGGVHNFLKRVWRLVIGRLGDWAIGPAPKNLTTQEPISLHMMHKTIKKVGEDIEINKFNTAIAALMTWLNFLEKRVVAREEVEAFLLLLAPFAPHITEELWSRLSGNQAIKPSGKRNPDNPTTRQPDNLWSIHSQPWPKYDPKFIESGKITLVVQVDGKLRDRIETEKGLNEKGARELALSSQKVKKYVSGKDYKVIYVQDKLINFVLAKN